jgi:hypothetical protein
MTRFLAVLVALLVAAPAWATPTQCFTDQAKKNFAQGAFQVPASACTGSEAPSKCCTGAGAGATCPVYKLALITNTSTAGCAATTWASISANEVGASGSYSAGGATLAGYSLTVSGNDAWVTFTSPVTFTTATITARAAVVYCASGCPTLDVIGIHCLDGGSCAADTTSTNDTFTVNLPQTTPGVYALTN